jgi:hypothetical protein
MSRVRLSHRKKHAIAQMDRNAALHAIRPANLRRILHRGGKHLPRWPLRIPFRMA